MKNQYTGIRKIINHNVRKPCLSTRVRQLQRRLVGKE